MFMPDNTKRSNKMAVNNLNRFLPELPLQDGTIVSEFSNFLKLTKLKQCYILVKFFKKTKKANGDPYPNSTLKAIADGIQRACRTHYENEYLVALQNGSIKDTETARSFNFYDDLVYRPASRCRHARIKIQGKQ